MWIITNDLESNSIRFYLVLEYDDTIQVLLIKWNWSLNFSEGGFSKALRFREVQLSDSTDKYSIWKLILLTSQSKRIYKQNETKHLSKIFKK